MARAFSDDLRRRILQAYLQDEGTQAELARRFRVSLDYVRKIHRQWRQTGKMERVAHRPGRKPLFTEPIRDRLRGWLKQQPDLTLAEMQEKLGREAHLGVSVPSLWTVLRKMDLRLKKSRSTPASATRKRIGNDGQRSLRNLPPSRRKS
jgi:transposase